jgi:hypothetical protein
LVRPSRGEITSVWCLAGVYVDMPAWLLRGWCLPKNCSQKRTMAVVHRSSCQPPPPQKSGHRPQIILPQADAAPPHTTHTTQAANCHKSETKVLYDRSDHFDVVSVDPTRFHTFKISVTKLSRYCNWKVPGVLQHIVQM